MNKEKKEERAQLAEEAYELAFGYDLDYGCCPQCVLTAVQDTIGIVTDDVIKAAHSLSGGGGLMVSGTCGAVTGGLLAISAKHGREKDDFGKKRAMKSFILAKQLIEMVKKEYGGTTCAYIQQKYTGRTWNMWDPDEVRRFKAGSCTEKCADLTGKIAQWVVNNI